MSIRGCWTRLAEELFEDGKISSRYEEFGVRRAGDAGLCGVGEVHNKYFDFTLSRAEVKLDAPFRVEPTRCAR